MLHREIYKKVNLHFCGALKQRHLCWYAKFACLASFIWRLAEGKSSCSSHLSSSYTLGRFENIQSSKRNSSFVFL